MAREKIKGKLIKSFNLAQEEAELVDYLSNAEGYTSQSEFIGWLIRTYNISKNPIQELQETKKQKEELSKQIQNLEIKEKEIIERMKAYEESQAHKNEMEKKAISFLVRKMREGSNRFELENIARGWAYRLNKDKDELIYKAGLELKNTQ